VELVNPEGVMVRLTKGQRAVIQDGLRRLSYNFAQEVYDYLETTKCERCRGTGLAPYVGGDDDDDPCVSCHGTGFKLRPLP
jgi:hypothetical protein